jgi:hypothetical protein
VSGERERRYLEDIAESIQLIDDYVRDGRPAFFEHRLVQDAVLRRLEIPRGRDRPTQRGAQGSASRDPVAGGLRLSQHRRARLPRHRSRARLGDCDGPSAGTAYRGRGGAPQPARVSARAGTIRASVGTGVGTRWEQIASPHDCCCPLVSSLESPAVQGIPDENTGCGLARATFYGTEGQRFESSRARSVSDAGSPVVVGDRRVHCRLREPRRVTIGVTTTGRK